MLVLCFHVLFHDELDRPPFVRRAYHFFAFTSFKIWICTAWSATNRLSRPFSSSSERKPPRLAHIHAAILLLPAVERGFG
jgi:hypothetical protein